MPKPFKGPKKNTAMKQATGGTSPRPPPSPTNGSSSSTSSNSSPRATAPRTRSPTVLHATTPTNDDDLHGIWMETATPGKFPDFQQKIFPVVEFLTSKPTHANHAFTKRWHALKRTPNIPMTADITWRNLKILLGITDLFEYRDFLIQCPEFVTIVTIKPSKTTRSGFDFGINANYDSKVSLPMHPTQMTSALSNMGDDESYVLDVNPPHADTQSITVDTTVTPNTFGPPDIETTPRQHNIIPTKGPNTTEDTDGSITTDGITDGMVETEHLLTWMSPETIIGFKEVHYRLFDSVNMWMQQDGVKRHPFYLKWQKAVFTGLTALTKWERVAKIFGLSYLQDYVTLMQECPRIQEQFDLSYDYFDNTVKCRELALPTTEDILQDISKLNVLQRKLQSLHLKIDSCMQQYNTRLLEAEARITACEAHVMDQLNRATSKFATSAAQHYHSFTEYASETFSTFKTNINEYTEKLMATQRTKLMEMHKANHDKIQNDFREAEDAFKTRLNDAIERALQEILTTADDATENINAQADHLCQQFQSKHLNHGSTTSTSSQSWRYAEPKPSKLFPNVDPSKFSSRNHDTKPFVSPMGHHADHEFMKATDVPNDDFVPPPMKSQFPHLTTAADEDLFSLQPVNHHDMMKRVQLPYPGREQSYIWYLQLKSNACQYGVYLIATEDFQKDKSLCPTEMYGIKINISRYNMMKTVLYHFLAQRTIISLEYNDLRNIINRHAVLTDGYHALYEIMERIHPALDPDVIFTAPQCHHYSNIHEYYTYLSSFIMHERLAGRHYTPREQLNYFLRGLDSSYNAAIKRIRSQMDGWQASDPNVPEKLVLANLPNLVEKYLEDEDADGTKAIVRRMGNGKNPRSNKDGDNANKPDDNGRQYVDIKCPLCQTYGHHKSNCDHMAIWLNLKEGSKLVDDKLRAKLQTAYAELDNKRRTRKLTKLRGTVRQLYQNGQFAEGEHLLNSAMYANDRTLAISSPHHSDSDDAASSDS